MLDANSIRDRLDDVFKRLESRGIRPEEEFGRLIDLNARRRELIQAVEGLKRDQNAASEQIARLKRAKEDASHLFDANRERGRQIKQREAELSGIEEERGALLMTLPNLPHESVPLGRSAEDNVEVRRVGAPPPFDFAPKAHWDLGPALGILDFERAAAMSGARFAVLLRAGARLARALTDFMLDLHTREHGYTEVEPPFLVKRAALEGTGNLPKFESDLFRIAGDEWDLFLIPTAEVPLTNLHRGETIDGARLPLKYTAYTPYDPASLLKHGV
jgi:seryl-tRNA synthetase